MYRHKYLLHYNDITQLRVEQIGPRLWGAALGTKLVVDFAEISELRWAWDPFTESTEEAAKRGAQEMASRRFRHERKGDLEWRVVSDMPDADWNRYLSSLSFPGYPPREDSEIWDGVLLQKRP